MLTHSSQADFNMIFFKSTHFFFFLCDYLHPSSATLFVAHRPTPPLPCTVCISVRVRIAYSICVKPSHQLPGPSCSSSSFELAPILGVENTPDLQLRPSLCPQVETLVLCTESSGSVCSSTNDNAVART